MLFFIAMLVFGPSTVQAADAEQLLRQGRLVEALDAAAKAVEARPDDVRVQELAIDVFLSTGQVERARSHAASRVAKAPNRADSHYLLGRAEVDPAASRAAYRKALDLDGAHARSHMGLAGLDEAGGDTGSAEQGYVRAVEIDASLTEGWVGLARVQLAAGRRDEAQATAVKGFAATKAPDLALILATLDPSRATQVLDEALATNGSSLVLHTAAARTALVAGHAARARQHAEQALALDPRALEARAAFHWARELDRRVVTRQVLATVLSPTTASRSAALERTASAAPKSAMVRFEQALDRQSRRDAGHLEDLVTGAKLDPSNDLVAEIAGQALLVAGRPADAIDHLTRAVGARPTDLGPSLLLAQALRKAGHPGDAVLLMERVASTHPQDVDTQLLYAQSLLEVGRRAEAYAVVKIAMLATADPRLVAAFVQIAPIAGRHAEAAAVLAPIAERTGNAELQRAVEALRNPKP